MNSRLLYVLAAAALTCAAFVATVLPASAQLHSVQVRLASGEVVTVEVDVPPGQTVESMGLPGEIISSTPIGPEDAEPPTNAPEGSAPAPDAGATPAVPGAAPGAPGAPPLDVGSEIPGALEESLSDELEKEVEKEEDKAGGEDEEGGRKRGGGKDPTGGTPAERRGNSADPGAPPLRSGGGAPTRSNPSFFDALPGPSRATSVPNFVIRKFRVPIFLLPIYQAAGIQYGVRWEVLAAINEIETDYGRNLNVSSAGAQGWMQFMPATWRMYGTDANKDGDKDPYNPVDAIFAAARYLKAAGAEDDLKKAIFAYNHADWYVDSVMMRAKLIAGVPSDLTGSLTGLTEGRFPVAERARYADDLSERDAERRIKGGRNAAQVVEGSRSRRDIDIYTKKGAPAVAVNDGVVKEMGRSKAGERYVVIQDVYGNRYTYSGLESISRYYPVPKDEGRVTSASTRLPGDGDPRPRAAASDGRPGAGAAAARSDAPARGTAPRGRAAPRSRAAASRPRPVVVKERLFAHPNRPNARRAGGLDQLLEHAPEALRGFTSFQNYFSRPIGLDAEDMRLKRMRRGARVIGGTIIGRVGQPDRGRDPHLSFEIRPAGRGAPRIDPKPILDGWKLLEATAIYRASGRNALYGGDGDSFSIGQVLLLPKPLLERRVLSDERIEVYDCGRRDIRSGQVDRRVLATLAFLAESGLRPSVTSLKCGHGVYTSSGNVSHHSSGNAVDIARVNGVPILGNQDDGSITEQTVKRLTNLQGTVRADQIISLLDIGGPTVAMSDHNDHIHVGFRPLFGENGKQGREAMAVLRPGQWEDLLDRLRRIDNPTVRVGKSKASIPARQRRASGAHRGE